MYVGYLETCQCCVSLLLGSLRFCSSLSSSSTQKWLLCVGKQLPLSSSERSTHTDEKVNLPAIFRPVEYLACTSEWQFRQKALWQLRGHVWSMWTNYVNHTNYSVPLKTGTCHIRGIFVLFLQDYCALQELLMKMNFTLAVAPPFVHPIASLLATPTHSVWKYGFLSEPTWQRQVAKYGNLKRCESLSFSVDIESLEPSKF